MEATFYKLAEAAKLMQVSRATVRHWILNGKLNATDISRPDALRKRYRISAQDIQAFQAGNSTAARVEAEAAAVPAKPRRSGIHWGL